MNKFISKRIIKLINSKDVVGSNFKTSVLPDDLSVSTIDFYKSRGSVRLVNQNVLTPAEENNLIDEILAFDFER
jgi:hypothetical protein